MSADFEFKNSHTINERKKHSAALRAKYDMSIPVICEIAKRNKSTIKLDKHKFLVPSYLNVGQFLGIIHKRIKKSPESAILIFVKDTLAPTSMKMNDLYNQYKDEDGFLYATICCENTFG